MYPSMFIEDLAAEHRRDLEDSARHWRLGRPARSARGTASKRRGGIRSRRRVTAAVATADQS